MSIMGCRLVLVLILLAISTNAYCYELILVRHFEKIADVKDPRLTSDGQKRAENLAALLKSSKIKKIYSTQYNRTKQTANPVATLKGITVKYYDPRQLESFAADLLTRQQSALIVGHSNTTPALIKLLGGEAKVIGEKDYGEVFFIRFEDDEVKQSSIIIPIQQ